LNWHIRPAETSDAGRCAEIYRPYVTDNWVSFETEAPDAAEMASRIADYGTSHAWLVADKDGEVAGYAYAGPHRVRAAYATSSDVAIYVDPDFARQGIAGQLYTALFETLKQRGIHAVFASIALPNAASIGFHEAMGFTPVGIYREVGWKMNAWRDVGKWQRLL
jgi:L-amino acid N-acyltransferase YncA